HRQRRPGRPRRRRLHPRMSLYESIRGLPLVVEGYELEPLALVVRPDFTRRTTLIHLHGAGEQGTGEDVTYDSEEQERQQVRGALLPLAGDWTVESLSAHLASLPLFEAEPDQHAYLDYRRWAFESAALDLALRQAGVSLGDAVGRVAQPVVYVASGGLGDPPTTDRLRRILDGYPGLRFKLDARPTCDDALIPQLVALPCPAS